MKSHLPLLILLHIRATESIVKDLASLLHASRRKPKISTPKHTRRNKQLKRKRRKLTSNASPSRTATCPKVLYLSQSSSLVNQTVHTSVSSPNGMENSGPSPATSSFSGEWLTWSRKTWRHLSLRKRCCESSKVRVWACRVFSQVVGGVEEAGEL